MAATTFEVISKECMDNKHEKCKNAIDCACQCHYPEFAEDIEAGEPEDNDY